MSKADFSKTTELRISAYRLNHSFSSGYMTTGTTSRLLIFYGQTGVGKSTQIRLLARRLEKRGLKVRCARVKPYYPLTRLLLKYCGKTDPSIRRWISHAACNLCASHASLFKSTIAIDSAINILTLLIASIFKVHIFLRLKHVVIVEEYLLETVTDYRYACENRYLNLRLGLVLVNLLLRFIPRDSIEVILASNCSSLEDRGIKRRSSSENSEYLATQQVIMEFCKKNMNNSIYIDTDNKNINDVHREILSKFL